MSTAPQDEYARFADLYDPILGPVLAEVRHELSALALRRRATNILDICCGTGAQLAPLHRAGLNCVGVDLSPAMLATARRDTPSGIRYIRCDAAALPLADAAFDLASITFALHEKPQSVRERMLSEAMRTLRPGGALAMVDYARPDGFMAHMGIAGAAVVERMAGKEHFALFKDFLRRGGIQGFLNAAGMPFEVVAQTHVRAIALVLAQNHTASVNEAKR